MVLDKASRSKILARLGAAFTAAVAIVSRDVRQIGRSPATLFIKRATRREQYSAIDQASDIDQLVDQMLAAGRYALLLRPQLRAGLSWEQQRQAAQALRRGMGLVPYGDVALEFMSHCDARIVIVEAFYLDRLAVTNCQFQDFVDFGGYQNSSLWDLSLGPALNAFVDETGLPGPAFWRHGRCVAGQEHHPVTGVSRYEACAYASWVGKRLPSDAEWLKAAAWPLRLPDGTRSQRRFAWGDAMDRRRANLWGSARHSTAPADQFTLGAGAAGHLQLVGNVWEWTASDYQAGSTANYLADDGAPLRSLRGGAFDTYFDNQAQCQFQSGDHAVARRRNVGFRCALGACDVGDALPCDPANADGVSYLQVAEGAP